MPDFSLPRHPLSHALSVILPPPEDTLLLRACLQPDESGRQACEAWLKRHDDPRNGFNREFVKAFLPMLFHAFQTHGIELDNSRMTILRTAAFREELRTQTYRRICRNVFSTLTKKGISAIVIKGAALSETVYPHPALRHSHDIEILLEPSDVEETTSLLTTLGFAAAGKISRRSLGGIQFIHESDLPLVLHVGLFQIPFYNSALPAIRSRSQTTILSEIPMRVLSPADALLHTCGHAAYYPSRQSNRWISDAWFIVDRCRDLDWDLLLDVARRSHLTLSLSITLGYLAEDLNATVPAGFLDRLFAASRTDVLGQELTLCWARSAPGGGVKNLLRKARGWRGRTSVLKWMVFPSPRYLMWAEQVRPSWLLPFHYARRLGRYVLRRTRQSFGRCTRRIMFHRIRRAAPHASRNTRYSAKTVPEDE